MSITLWMTRIFAHTLGEELCLGADVHLFIVFSNTFYSFSHAIFL